MWTPTDTFKLQYSTRALTNTNQEVVSSKHTSLIGKRFVVLFILLPICYLAADAVDYTNLFLAACAQK